MPKKLKALIILIILNTLTISSAQAGFFSSRYSDFKELVDAGKIEEATALHAKERVYFSELKDDKRKFVDDILTQRDQRYGTILTEASVSLIFAEAETRQMKRWQLFKKGFEQAQIAIASVEELPEPGPLMTNGLASLKASVERKMQTLQSGAPQALLEYGLFTEPLFSTVYPLPERWVKTPQFTALVEAQLTKASIKQLESFKKIYGYTLIPTLDLAPKLTELYVANRVSEAGANSYLAKRLVRERLEKEGWSQFSEDDSKVLLAAWPAPKSEVSGYQVAQPTSIAYMGLDAAQTPNDVIKSPTAQKRDLIVFVRSSPIRIERNEANIRQINSRYQTGTRRVSNPAYTEAQRALTRATESLAYVNATTANTSSGSSNLEVFAAVVSGVSQAAAESRVRDARRVLENTPSVIDEPVFAPYTYTAKSVAVKHLVTIQYAVYEPSIGQVTTGSIDRNSDKTIYVIDSVHSNDPSYSSIMSNATTPQNVETWIKRELTDKYDAIWVAILADYKEKNLGI